MKPKTIWSLIQKCMLTSLMEHLVADASIDSLRCTTYARHGISTSLSNPAKKSVRSHYTCRVRYSYSDSVLSAACTPHTSLCGNILVLASMLQCGDRLSPASPIESLDACSMGQKVENIHESEEQ